jgi:tetratricopeptide (TPR) repeat protein
MLRNTRWQSQAGPLETLVTFIIVTCLISAEYTFVLNTWNERYAQSLKEGDQLAKQERYCEAIAILNKAVHAHPNNLLAYLHRGRVYGILGEYERALRNISKAIDPELVNDFETNSY